MQISLAAIVALVGASGFAQAAPGMSATGLETLQSLNDEAIATLKKQNSENDGKSSIKFTSSAKPNKGCSVFNAGVRRDWRALSKKQRRVYIDAVLCLMDKPSKADPSFAPGAKNRYDDFVAVHINQTLSIHGTGNFLTWHRYYTWAYETALREECGYTGYQPYWNWFDGSDFANSPVFDGSDTSMSGDGAYVAHNGSLSGSNNIWLPSGAGGGCVTSGPFVNMSVNLGPVAPGMDGLAPNPNGPLTYNPRCLSRDLSKYAVDTWMTVTNLWNITLGDASGTIGAFQNELQGRFGDLFMGMHAAGHFTMNGDSSDLFSSCTDPAFFLHHSMLDRLYWIWQILHPAEANKIAGTITVLNTPPSRDTLKEDPLNMGVNAPEITIRDALNTMGGTPFCYIYL